MALPVPVDRVASLEVEVADLRVRLSIAERESAALRAFLPPRPPAGWMSAKQKSAQVGCSTSLCYKNSRCGKFLSQKLLGRIYFAP